MANERPDTSQHVSPTACANAVLKLMLFSYFYVRHGSGVLDSEGNPAGPADERTNRLVKRVIDDIDKLWEHLAKIFRDDAVMDRMHPPLVEIETRRRSNEPIEEVLDGIRRGWKNWTGEELTPVELSIFTLDPDVRMGIIETAEYRLGKMLDISARQVRKIRSKKTPSVAHFCAQESPLDAPFPYLARYIAALYFFTDVLRWPTPDETALGIEEATRRFDGVSVRLREVSIAANRHLSRSATQPAK